jgi:hypothetical protein
VYALTFVNQGLMQCSTLFRATLNKFRTGLITMEQIVPWQALGELIKPHYPKAGNERPPIGLQRMLRTYFVQHWFNLSEVRSALRYRKSFLQHLGKNTPRC